MDTKAAWDEAYKRVLLKAPKRHAADVMDLMFPRLAVGRADGKNGVKV